MSRKNSSEFNRFFPQGLNPFKIHGSFKLELVPKFMSWHTLEIWSLSNWQSCSIFSKGASCQVWIFLDHGKVVYLNLHVWYDLEYWKILKSGWPTGQRPRTRLDPLPQSLWAIVCTTPSWPVTAHTVPPVSPVAARCAAAYVRPVSLSSPSLCWEETTSHPVA
jgi:hypothetical protein